MQRHPHRPTQLPQQRLLRDRRIRKFPVDYHRNNHLRFLVPILSKNQDRGGCACRRFKILEQNQIDIFHKISPLYATMGCGVVDLTLISKQGGLRAFYYPALGVRGGASFKNNYRLWTCDSTRTWNVRRISPGAQETCNLMPPQSVVWCTNSCTPYYLILTNTTRAKHQTCKIDFGAN